MSIDSDVDLIGIQEASKAVALTLKKMQAYARPGMSTKELDDYGFELLRSMGANSAPQVDYNFPGATCISVNHEVCHGIPSKKKILQEGDLVNIDVSAELNGFYGDNGGSFVLGRDLYHFEELVTASKEILKGAIAQVRSGVRIADVGGYIEMEAKKRGFQVIKNLCGHGIGRKLHEPPSEIPNFRDRSNRLRFKKDSVIALETFISTNAQYAYEEEDGWTMVTPDTSYVAQHEHTLIVTDDLPIILTEANGIFDAL
ncbi:MAG: type I methionyl aminopeptidase [Phaeodactylibacter sp.]|nr:type I methionyl aminopeptidase [Phaeodactylibacter sp.]